MPRKSTDNTPKGIETRSAQKGQTSASAKTSAGNSNPEGGKNSKAVKAAKSTKTSVRDSPHQKDQAPQNLSENIKAKANLKAKSPKQRVNKGPKIPANKQAKPEKAEKGGSQIELLDYDEEGLDDDLINESGQTDDLSRSSSGESSETSSSSSSDSNEDGNSSDQLDFSDSNEREGAIKNKNNAASPENKADEEAPPKKRKKVKSPKGDENQKGAKVVTMTAQDLQKLMNETIANYEKNKVKVAPPQKRKVDDINSTLSKSSTTIYKRLCPPADTHTGNLVTDNVEQFTTDVGQVTSDFHQMEVDDQRCNSDESLAAQFNSSDELMDQPSIVGLPLPPPPERVQAESPTNVNQQQHPRVVAQEKSAELVKQAELQKAELAKPPGENQNSLMIEDLENKDNIDGSLDYLHNSETAHVDTATRDKIKADLHVELYRLLPRDLDLQDEDDNLVLTSKMGKTYHVPPLDREDNTIGTFKKWQIAFKVFMSVYIEEHPDRLKKPLELIKYTQMIEGMTTTWIWENVFKYDKRHRKMMQTFPKRKWHVPYDAGKQELRVTHARNTSANNSKFKKSSAGNKSKKDPCRNFNKGKCNYGAACRFDHRCSHCGKYGHPATNCRAKERDPVEVPPTATPAQTQ